jgi:hypothetical protein
MRLPTFAHHAPKSFEEPVNIKCDFADMPNIDAIGHRKSGLKTAWDC